MKKIRTTNHVFTTTVVTNAEKTQKYVKFARNKYNKSSRYTNNDILSIFL